MTDKEKKPKKVKKAKKAKEPKKAKEEKPKGLDVLIKNDFSAMIGSMADRALGAHKLFADLTDNEKIEILADFVKVFAPLEARLAQTDETNKIACQVANVLTGPAVAQITAVVKKEDVADFNKLCRATVVELTIVDSK